ncbi:MAG: sodium:solute symporter [Candidatus Methylomirabilales bacterium]
MPLLWVALVGYGTLMFLVSPRAADARGFYWGYDARGRQTGFWLLTCSTFITWIFAKSVTNAANLGATYGIVGGLAYATYYLSIPVAGIVIVSIRKRLGAQSLSEFLVSRYGRTAATAFLLVVTIRLFNEVWSNTAVVGSYFGEKGSPPYYGAAFLFTGLTLLYSLKGGLRSSIITDMLQLVLAGFLLFLLLFHLFPRVGPGELLQAGEFSFRGGLDILLVAFLQIWSYPFHDPVLTDRAFISDRRVTVPAFWAAGIGGILFILLSSFIGIYAFKQGLPFTDDAPRVVASSFGLGILFAMNVIMLCSAGSTLDSTLSSISKEAGVDLATIGFQRWKGRVTIGKVAMVAIAVLGNLPLFAGASILQATTISGTMVMGLAPIFILHFLPSVPRASFHLAFWTGLGLGVLYTLGWIPHALAIGNGRYAMLLGVNLYGLLLCTGLYLFPWAFQHAAQVRYAGLSALQEPEP